MSLFWTTILEILKITIPALIVFLTVYSVFKKYLENQVALKQAELRLLQGKDGLSLKLQALERVTLLCERISIPNLLLRIRTPEMNNGTLKLSLLLALQQEFEHNVTQQLYLSPQLWQIISAARDQTVNVMDEMAKELDPKGEGSELASRLMSYAMQTERNASDIALQAIKQEAKVLIG